MPDFPGGGTRYDAHGVLGTSSIVNCEAGWLALANAQAMSASTAWGTANLGIYIPVILDVPVRVYKMSVANGATAGGNTDVGIYDEKGTRLVSIGPTAQAGTSAIQTFDITDTFLMPGTYHLGLANTTTTGTYLCAAFSVVRGRMSGCRQQTGLTSGTLPNPAVFATWAQTFCPLLCAHYETVV